MHIFLQVEITFGVDNVSIHMLYFIIYTIKKVLHFIAYNMSYTT